MCEEKSAATDARRRYQSSNAFWKCQKSVRKLQENCCKKCDRRMYLTLLPPTKNFLTPNEDCSKSFCIKTFLRIHRCLKYWESEKKFAKPLSRAFQWDICQHQAFSFFTQLCLYFWSNEDFLRIYFRCQPQALGCVKIQLVRCVRTNLGNAEPFSLKFLSLIGFPLLTLKIASTS